MRFFLVPLFITFVVPLLAAKTRTVYEFPNPTWLENIASMRNGSLLVTVIGRAEVYIVEPFQTPATSRLVASFASSNAVLGITELRPDVFAIAVGSTVPPSSPVPGSFSIHTLDLSTPNRAARISKVADLTTMQGINGIAALNPSMLLLADSWAGNIVRLDMQTRASNITLQDSTLRSNFTAPLPLGVNGLKVPFPGVLYYSNTVLNLLGRVRVDAMTGRALSNFEVFAKGEIVSGPDDFVVERDGRVVLARAFGDTVQRVGMDGKVEILVNGGDVAGATALAFGRGRGNGKLYVCTSGLVGGVPMRGGRVVQIEL